MRASGVSASLLGLCAAGVCVRRGGSSALGRGARLTRSVRCGRSGRGLDRWTFDPGGCAPRGPRPASAGVASRRGFVCGGAAHRLLAAAARLTRSVRCGRSGRGLDRWTFDPGGCAPRGPRPASAGVASRRGFVCATLGVRALTRSCVPAGLSGRYSEFAASWAADIRERRRCAHNPRAAETEALGTRVRSSYYCLMQAHTVLYV